MLDMLQIGILRLLSRFRRDESGAAMVEYGLLVALIAAVAAAGAVAVGTNLLALFTAIGVWLATFTPLP